MKNCESTIKSLDHYDKLIRRVIDKLQQLLNGDIREGERQKALSLMDDVFGYLTAQFELEEEDGYLVEVLEKFPNWHPQLQHLQQEHRLLHRQFSEIRDRLASTSAFSALSCELRRHLNDWVESFQRHQERENKLLLESYILDVGEGE